MPIPDLLRELLTTPGPSGHESRAAAVWRRAAAEFAEVTTDAMGATFARVRGRGDGPTVAIMGHIDEIGFLVTHVDADGFVSLVQIGGADVEVLVGQRILLLGRGVVVPGVIARRQVRRSERADRPRVELQDLHVDLGVSSAEEAGALVRVGDAAVLAGEPFELANDRVASRSMDNRIGAYVALEAARRIAEAGGAPGDVVAVASVQEEIGHSGARTAAFALEPDVAFAVDITPADDVPGGDPRESGHVGLGDGPALDRAPIMNPRLIELLEQVAADEGIRLCYEISPHRTRTDADDLQESRGGIPTALVSVPLRYTHTPVETVQLSDVEDAIRLLVATVLRLDGSFDLSR